MSRHAVVLFLVWVCAFEKGMRRFATGLLGGVGMDASIHDIRRSGELGH